MRCLAILFITLLAGCGSRIYDEARPGEFTGSILVMWVGPGTTGSGDGRFVYVPDPRPGKGLVFTRHVDPNSDSVNIIRIEPEWMYTDGGSVPRPLQVFRGLNPWGYAPAYMVHDWLFVARKCLRDGMATKAEADTAGVTFRETYEIMAETVKTLEDIHQVSGSDVQPAAITWAVSSSLSRESWDETGGCARNRLTQDHERQVRARLGIGPDGAQARVLMDGVRVRPADLVARIEF